MFWPNRTGWSGLVLQWKEDNRCANPVLSSPQKGLQSASAFPSPMSLGIWKQQKSATAWEWPALEINTLSQQNPGPLRQLGAHLPCYSLQFWKLLAPKNTGRYFKPAFPQCWREENKDGREWEKYREITKEKEKIQKIKEKEWDRLINISITHTDVSA